MQQQGIQVTGSIISFNAKKGFGFLASDQAESDIYFQTRALQKEVKDCLDDSDFIDLVGHSVACTINYTTDNKPQASDVVLTVSKEDDFLVGVVRSFNQGQGYGFLTCAGYENGIYFKLKFIPGHLQGGSLIGQPARFNLKITEDGKFQANTISFKKPVMLAPIQAMMHGMQKGGVSGMGGMMTQRQMAPMAPVSFGKGAAFAGGAGGVSSQAMSGIVISFNPAKGWGFIQSAAVMGDVYFKADGEFSTGAPVSFSLKYTQDGRPQASNVTPAIAEDEFVIGSIKSFFADKGYGFLTAPGQPADIYFKAEALPSDLIGQQDLVGKQLRFTVSIRKDGKMQVASATSAGHGGMGAKRTMAEIHLSQAATPAQKRQKASGFFTCTVRSYNATKRYGFLNSPQLGNDIYFQGRLLPAEYENMALEGATGKCEVTYTPDGKPQAASLQLD
mmetsp:Transcript_142685/g.248817  ORF Transcript_142685/g.248817 Transcript_142685/m.248817 type:complete len:446 (-) Transcript_142685:505-1842(-)